MPLLSGPIYRGKVSQCLYPLCRESIIDAVCISLPYGRNVKFGRIRDKQGVWVLSQDVWRTFLSSSFPYKRFANFRRELNLCKRLADTDEVRTLQSLKYLPRLGPPVSLLQLDSACYAVKKLTGNASLAKAVASLGSKPLPDSPCSADGAPEIFLRKRALHHKARLLSTLLFTRCDTENLFKFFSTLGKLHLPLQQVHSNQVGFVIVGCNLVVFENSAEPSKINLCAITHVCCTI